jgi:AraC-like DNA-binding protein
VTSLFSKRPALDQFGFVQTIDRFGQDVVIAITPVLVGEQGASMRAAPASEGQFGKIAKAVRRIHTTFKDRLTVDRLAREAGMSIPTLHTHFRTVTQSSPRQYRKSVRLHQARLLMLRNEKTASAASIEVGYESASQFSRKFKRFFGHSASDEVVRLKSRASQCRHCRGASVGDVPLIDTDGSLQGGRLPNFPEAALREPLLLVEN